MAALSKLANRKDDLVRRFRLIWDHVTTNLRIVSAFLDVDRFNRILTKSIRVTRSSIEHLVRLLTGRLDFDVSVVFRSISHLVDRLMFRPRVGHNEDRIVVNAVGGVGYGFIIMFLDMIMEIFSEALNNIRNHCLLRGEIGYAVIDNAAIDDNEGNSGDEEPVPDAAAIDNAVIDDNEGNNGEEEPVPDAAAIDNAVIDDNEGNNGDEEPVRWWRRRR